MRGNVHKENTGLGKYILLTFLSLFLIAAATGCSFSQQEGNSNLLSVGHSGGNLTAALYIAQDNERFNESYKTERFQDNSTIGYGLLSGQLDVGFVDAEKLKALSQLEGFENLKAVGKITYPYGSTLILRKDLNRKITDLKGLNIAVSSANCKLLQAFKDDAKRLGADLSGINYTTLEFDAMLPALEAGKVDGVIIKGFYSVIALKEGHKILYQNWDVTPGDACCPAIVDQAAMIMVTVESKYEEAKALATLLEEAQQKGEDNLRLAIADHTTIPYDILKGQPVPTFLVADDEIIKAFLEAEDHDGDEHSEDTAHD